MALPLPLAICSTVASNPALANGPALAALLAPASPSRDIGIYRSLEPGFPPMPEAEYLFDNTREGKTDDQNPHRRRP